LKTKPYISLFLTILISTIFSNLLAQNIITGLVIDEKSKEELIGANIIIKNENNGTTTDLDGGFSIIFNKLPVSLECSYIGYQTQTIEVQNENQKIIIKLLKDDMVLGDINVVDTRLSEKLKQSAVTIEAMDVIAIKEAPSASFYEGLGNLKGVDLTSASLAFKIINTRGFNSTSPVRSLQIIDGVDNQSPGLNFSLGNFLGTTELDTKGVEIIVGANSALYGPNAFNGVINMSTKDPFMFPGTSYQIKMGERALIEHCFRYAGNKKIKNDWEIGLKFNIQQLKANDWEADNIDASYDTNSDANNPGGYDAVNIYGDEFNKTGSFNDFPGIGTVHRTGYLESDLADYNTKNLKFNTAIHLKKNKNELIYGFNLGNGTTIYQGDNRYSLKNIRFWQNKIEFKRNDNFFIRFYTTHEDAGDSYDIVATAQALTAPTAASHSDWNKQNSDWFNTEYVVYWNETIIPLMESQIDGFMTEDDWLTQYGSNEGWQEAMQDILSQYPDLLSQYHEQTREWTDYAVGSLIPGSENFNLYFNDITSKSRFDEYGNETGGTRFFDKSSLYNIQTEKKIKTEYGTFKIGLNGRLYSPDSQGSIFDDGYNIETEEYVITDSVGAVIMDSSYELQLNMFGLYDTIWTESPRIGIDSLISRKKIQTHEFGAYFGYDKKLFSETFLVSATARVDKNKNYNYLFSPAASVVYKPNERDIIRLSLSSAVRNPTLTDQYLNYDAGPATLVGNINGFGLDGFDPYGYGTPNYFVTIDAILDYFDSETTLGNNAGSAVKNGRLKIEPIKPEQVKTLEVGFRTTLLNKVYIDASYYYSLYTNFIGYQFGCSYEVAENLMGEESIRNATAEDVELGWAEYIGEEIPDYTKIDEGSISVWRVAANATGKVKTQGFSVGINYYMSEKIALNGNYSWNKLINEESRDPLVPAFNTPEHKFNVGISNKFSFKRNSDTPFSMSLNYKWIQGFLFEGSPQFTGNIPSYGLLDGQINRTFKLHEKLELTTKIGVSNLLNNQVYQAYGGPRIGRLTYLTLTFELD
jgi:iron complex outermembrane receptor protein